MDFNNKNISNSTGTVYSGSISKIRNYIQERILPLIFTSNPNDIDIKMYDLNKKRIIRDAFIDCSRSNTDVADIIIQSHFINCNFNAYAMHHIDFSNSTFEKCTFEFDEANLVNFTSAVFNNCIFKGKSQFIKCNLSASTWLHSSNTTELFFNDCTVYDMSTIAHSQRKEGIDVHDPRYTTNQSTSNKLYMCGVFELKNNDSNISKHKITKLELHIMPTEIVVPILVFTAYDLFVEGKYKVVFMVENEIKFSDFSLYPGMFYYVSSTGGNNNIRTEIVQSMLKAWSQATSKDSLPHIRNGGKLDIGRKEHAEIQFGTIRPASIGQREFQETLKDGFGLNHTP